jgi:hypothetical protein
MDKDWVSHGDGAATDVLRIREAGVPRYNAVAPRCPTSCCGTTRAWAEW